MTTTHQPATAVTTPAAGTYLLDPAHSHVAFATRHLFGLAAVHGAFTVTAGSITVAADPESSVVEAVAASASFDTGDRRRDTLITARRFLDAENHPEIAYRSTAMTRTDGAGWILHGELTAVGRSAPLDLAVTVVRQDGDVLNLQATGRVDRHAHGLTAARGLAARHLQVTVTARARR